MSLLMGSVAGVILGAIYAFGIFHSPLIYLNFILTGALGFALGIVVTLGVDYFHIRNRAVAVFIGLIVFCVAYITAWLVYIPTVLAHFGNDTSSFDVPFILEWAYYFAQNPRLAFEWIQFINYNGVWTITSPGSRQPGISMSGIILALIWLAEAAIICFITIMSPHEAAGKPYSERQGKWLVAKALPGVIAYVENRDAFLNAFVRGDFSALSTPLAVDESPAEGEEGEEADDVDFSQYATVTLYADSYEPYVTVQNVSRSVSQTKEQTQKPSGGFGRKIWGWVKGWFSTSSSDDDGTTITDVVNYLKISPTVAQNISNALGE